MSSTELYLRGNRYWYRIKHPVSGEIIRESTGSEDGQWAQEYLDKLKAGLWREKLGESKQYTWDDAALRWIEEKTAAKKADLPGDLQKIEWLNQHFSGKPLKDLTREFVRKTIAKKVAEPSRVKGRSKATSTGQRYLAVVRGIMRNAANIWGMLDKNDLPQYEAWAENTDEIERYLTYAEAKSLLIELPLHLRMAALFGFSTGLRRENILAMKWSRVNFDTKTVVIPRGRKGQKMRGLAVPLNEGAMAVLIARRKASEGKIGDEAEYVFTYKGRRMKECCTKAWYKALKRAGLVGVRFHDTRHSWASWLRQLGVSLATIMELGGWKRMEMVMRYAHITPELHAREAAHTLDGILDLPETPEAISDAAADGPANLADLALET